MFYLFRLILCLELNGFLLCVPQGYKLANNLCIGDDRGINILLHSNTSSLGSNHLQNLNLME